MKIQFKEGILVVVKPKCWNLDGNFRGKIVNVKNKPRSIIHPCPRGFRVASQSPARPLPSGFFHQFITTPAHVILQENEK